MDKILYIMRGPPGSGKSFEVNKILQKYGIQSEGHVFSTDEYLEKSKDGYKETIKKAIAGGYFAPMMYKFHMLNQERAFKAIEQGVTPIIIDNMNLDNTSMKPYVQAGLVHDYKIEFVEPSSEHWGRIAPLLQNKKLNAEQIKWAAHNLSKKNSHDVPFDSILKFLKKWQINPKVEDFQ
jgi:adenylate kinase family enzyme